MRSNYLTSIEGWNFDRLAVYAHKWYRVGQQNFYLSDFVKVGELYIQLLKSYDRIVGFVDRKEGETPLVVKLGTWSKTTSGQIDRYANKNYFPILETTLFSKEFINRLQDGLIENSRTEFTNKK